MVMKKESNIRELMIKIGLNKVVEGKKGAMVLLKLNKGHVTPGHIHKAVERENNDLSVDQINTLDDNKNKNYISEILYKNGIIDDRTMNIVQDEKRTKQI